MSWATRFRIRQRVEGSLWVVPLLGVVLGVLLGFLDIRVEGSMHLPSSWTYSPSTASTVLSAIVGAMAALTGFVVTVTCSSRRWRSAPFPLAYGLEPTWVVRSAAAGAVQAIDLNGFVRWARERNCLLVLEHGVGDFVPTGATLISIYGGRYGSSSIQVMRRMRALLEQLQGEVRPEYREAVTDELARLDAPWRPPTPSRSTLIALESRMTRAWEDRSEPGGSMPRPAETPRGRDAERVPWPQVEAVPWCIRTPRIVSSAKPAEGRAEGRFRPVICGS